MTEATVLWVVSCTSAPDKHILHILHQISVNVIAEILNCAATSIL